MATCAALVTAAAAAVAAGPLHPVGRPDDGTAPPSVAGPIALGPVVVPIAYELTLDAPPAAARLRDLARTIGSTAYDRETGRYAYRRGKSWGAAVVASPEGYAASFVEEEQTWTAADGTGRHIQKVVALEFPDDGSRRYWQREIAKNGFPAIPQETIQDLPFEASASSSPTPSPDTGHPRGPARPTDQTRPPWRRSDVAKLLRAEHGPFDAAKWTMELYRAYVVPRETRRQVLQILASLDGFVWRGRVTDRAGRAGVAISAAMPDGHSPDVVQAVLVFDPRTGELLAWELLRLTPHEQTDAYVLILPPGRVDTIGATPRR